jgi:hypothetical protein
MHPPGPNYWLPSMNTCQRHRHAAPAQIFNFFSERVRSAPEFTFPPPPPPETLPSRPMRPLSTPLQRLSESSISDSAPRQWADRRSVPSVDSVQAPDPFWDNQPGEDARNGRNILQEDETEGDNAEKPEDFGPSGSGQIPWAER